MVLVAAVKVVAVHQHWLVLVQLSQHVMMRMVVVMVVAMQVVQRIQIQVAQAAAAVR